jgi:hypothetical protein
MPDTYDDAWRQADADYDRRQRQATALLIAGTLDAHHWDGGFHCRCGMPVGMPADWGRHLLELVLFDDDTLGVDPP